MEKCSGKYYIGMDAGGTGTSVLISDGENDLFQMKTEGLNCNSFPRERIARSLQDVAEGLKENGYALADCGAIAIGAAGNNNPAADALLRNLLESCGFRCPVTVCSDADAALYGALGEEDGLLLISGTGSICLGQTQGGRERYRAGGFGHLIDDEGSAYAIGRDIAAAVVKAEDGRGPETTLRGALFRHLGISGSPELVGYIYDMSHTKKDIARLARLISLPENEGDRASAQIIGKAVDSLLEMVTAVYGRMEARCGSPELPLVLHGSVLLGNPRIAVELTEAISHRLPGIRIAQARADAAHGAVGLARKHAEIL